MTNENLPRRINSEHGSEPDDDDDDDDGSVEEMELVDVLEPIDDADLPSDDELGESNGVEFPEDEEEMIDIDEEHIPLRDEAVMTFNKHTNSIFACDLNNDGSLAITGGQDDTACIWDTSTGEVLLSCATFTDSVVTAKFSHDGKYALAGDMLGNVIVWKTTEKKITEVYKETFFGANWIEWHTHINAILAAGSSVWLVKIPSGVCKVFPTHGSNPLIGHLFPDGKRAMVGYEDGILKVFDLSDGGMLNKFETGKDNMLCSAVHRDNVIAAVGSTNGRVAIYNTQTSKIVNSLNYCPESQTKFIMNYKGVDKISEANIECLLFGGDGPLNVLVVGTDYSVLIWDYARMSVRHEINIAGGVTRMVWPDKNPNVYLGTREGPVIIFNPLTGIEMENFDGHRRTIMDISHSKNGLFLITGSDDKTAKIFKMDEERPATAKSSSVPTD